jgi:hypothetical protein
LTEPAPNEADAPLTLGQQALWVLVVLGVLLAVVGMVLVYWPGLQLTPR